MLKAAIQSDGDATIRSSVMDIAREIDWPKRYTARVLKNGFTDQWHEDQEALIAAGKAEADKWRVAWAEGNTDIANTFVGEVTSLIQDIPSAQHIIDEMVGEASKLIRNHGTKTVKLER